MKKKIYIVTSGEYSDYHIDAVFKDKKIAKEFIRKFPDEYENQEIEEWPLMDVNFEGIRSKDVYFVRMKKDGEALEIKKENTPYYAKDALNKEHGYDCNGNLYMSVFAKDEKHAVKITNERRVQLIASNQWKKNKD